MRKILLIAALPFLLLSTAAKADTTWGLGVGPLYSGLGINFGRTTASSLTFASLGCNSLSNNRAENSKSDDFESSCGVGVGHLSTALFKSNRHAFGLNLDTSYNSIESQTELRIRPGYFYFFKGINKSGFNLGVGPNFFFNNKSSNKRQLNNRGDDPIRIFFNIGYQF